jgi:hypothetical protein
MSQMPQFKKGDRVRHTRRPEWGQGVVDVAQLVLHEGQPVQRLVVQFANYGRITVNTALAPIVRADQYIGAPAAQSAAAPASVPVPHAAAQPATAVEDSPQHPVEIGQLPEPATDPFSSPVRRLRATMDLYRFGDGPRGLIDWAVAQTGLNDPLSRYSRHELEQHFDRFRRNLETHLRDLARQIKRAGDSATLNELLTEHPQLDARKALRHALQHL